MKLILIEDKLLVLYDYEVSLLKEDGVDYEIIMENIL